MNTEKLLTTINYLINDEKEYEIQDLADLVITALSNISSSPSEPTYQIALAASIENLKSALLNLQNTYSPAAFKKISEIGAVPYFSVSLANDIKASLQENSATPTVTLRETQKVIKEREEFIDSLQAIKIGLEKLGFVEDALAEGEAEIGFQIPRDIFNNDLGGLAKELNELRLIIRTFSEIAGNAGEQIEVRQISTTDPIFWVGLGIYTVRLLGQATTWALDSWKKVEEIKKLRTETAKLVNVPVVEQILEQYNTLINQSITDNVNNKIAELIGPKEDRDARANEMATALDHALHGLMARIERGMIVEIRILPPPVAEGVEPNEANDVQAVFEDVRRIKDDLIFPTMSGEPTLALPSNDTDIAANKNAAA
jgi:hypothetical protein